LQLYAEKDRNGVPVIKKNRNGVLVRSGSKRTLDAGQLRCVLPVKFQATVYRAVSEHNIDGDGWRRKESGTGTGGDGSQRVREWVGLDVKDAGTVRDGTEIPSPCMPLV